MRLALALLLLLAGPAVAAEPPKSPAERAAEQRRQELDRAFEALKSAPDEAGAMLVEGRIRALWQQSAGPAVALLQRRGARNIAANQPADALEDFDAAITLQPDFAESWYLRAEAYARAGDTAAAGRDLQEALRLEPRHWSALESLAELQEAAGDAEGAMRTLGAALAINPKLAGGAEKLKEWRRKAEGEAL